MKINKLLLTALLALISFNGIFAQRNPGKEILVFFHEGVERQSKEINGEAGGIAVFKSASLLLSLTAMGLKEDAFEAALPLFKQADTLVTLTNGEKLRQLDMSKLFRFTVPDGLSKEDLIKKLSTLPEVLYAESNATASHQAIPSDSRYEEQWGLHNHINPGADIHAEAAWDIYTGNPDNIIAVIDGGTDATHEDLNGKINGGDAGWGWEGHGVHVSGIAAAESNNSQGISGVDWQAKIHAKRIDEADIPAMYQAVVDAVNFSPNVHVLNNSWGLRNPTDGGPGEDSYTIRQAFAYAYKANRTSVVASGNSNLTFPGRTVYPGSYDDIITVGATDIADNIAGFSNRGAHLDVTAPGVNILSTLPNNTYDLSSGTSMATPHVSGIASLLKGFNQNLANDDIRNIIQLSADDRGIPGFDNDFGFGRVNAGAALRLLQPPYTVNQWTRSSGTSVSTSGNYLMAFYGAGNYSGTRIVRRHEITKAITFPHSFCHIVGIWGTGVGSRGWNQANPNYGVGFTDIVPGTLTSTGVTLRTYVYEMYNTYGQYLGYSPATPGGVVFAYTVLGIPGTPASPTISANPTSINSGGSSTLTASGCAGTLTWSTGQTGNSISVSPAQTTAYTVTCSQFSCPNTTSAPESVTVGSPPSGACSSENIVGYGNSSENNTYTVNVGTSGTYNLKINYAKWEGTGSATGSIQVNGGSSQSITLPSTGDPNNYQDVTLSVTLQSGSNNIKIFGGPNGYFRTKKVCAEEGSGCNPPSLSASPSSINNGQSSVLSAAGCSGTVSWSHSLGTGKSKTVWPASTTTYTATCSENNCTSGSSSVTVTVNNSPNNCSAEHVAGLGNASENYTYVVNVGTAGNYSLKINYAKWEGSGNATGSVAVNGGSSQSISLASTGGPDSYQDVSLTAALQSGNNNIQVFGGSNGYFRTKKVCIDAGPFRVSAEAGQNSTEENTEPNDLTVSPNPSNGEFEASFYLEKGQKATLSVSDLQGKTWLERGVTGKGSHREKIKLAEHSAGTFLVLLRKNNGTEVKKAIIIR